MLQRSPSYILPIPKNTDPITAPNVEEASALLRRRNLVAVPIVDAQGIIQQAVVEDHDTVMVLTRESGDAPSDDIAAVVVRRSN